jgi:UDP:flavonoid glycosyltransferase YjiC (YdhE family)
MPVFNDQGDVRARVEKKGIGLGLAKDASAEHILRTIHKVINNQR